MARIDSVRFLCCRLTYPDWNEAAAVADGAAANGAAMDTVKSVWISNDTSDI